MLEHIDDGEPGVVGGQAVPGVARVEQPLLHVAVVSACVRRPRSLNGQAVLIRRHPLKLQARIWARLLSGAAVSVSEDGVVADGKHALPLFSFLTRLILLVLVVRALHVPRHGEAGVSGGLGRDAAAQTDGSGLLHSHI